MVGTGVGSGVGSLVGATVASGASLKWFRDQLGQLEVQAAGEQGRSAFDLEGCEVRNQLGRIRLPRVREPHQQCHHLRHLRIRKVRESFEDGLANAAAP